MPDHFYYSRLSNALRFLSIDSVENASSGHPGMPMGMSDVVTVLFHDFIKFNINDPNWINRDRFILSAGHGSAMLYSLFYLLGYPDVCLEDLKNFRKIHSKTAGHPEHKEISAIETTTGPLGQGLATSVGIALAGKILQAKFKSQNLDYKVYVLVSDGDLMEGISHEALSFAGHFNINNLVVLFDDNGITIDGKTSLTCSDDHAKRLEAYGWHTQKVDGHNYEQIYNAFKNTSQQNQPCFIAFKTTIGYGSPSKAGTSSCHGSPLGKQELDATRKNLNWTFDAFETPDDILKSWRSIHSKWLHHYEAWQKNPNNELKNFLDDKNYVLDIKNFIEKIQTSVTSSSTRQLSQDFIDYIFDKIPNLIGGSADLSPSNNTRVSKHTDITVNDKSGNYLHYGIREHAMGAIMNGLSLSGFIPYGGTFLVFSDYLKPSLRLSALMKQKVIYIFTHDSIGLGEDGPTHQPIEHLSSLRSIPNLLVFRPCDGVELAENWCLALNAEDQPSALILSRQNLPTLRKEVYEKNLSSYGAYELKKSNFEKKVIIFATGSEVQIALDVQKKLDELKIGSSVVSMPCWQLFDNQSEDYKNQILGNDSNFIKVAIEAGSELGWHKYIGSNGIFVGMKSFGASGKYEDLYKYFKITVEDTINLILTNLNKK
jgi:transketolase